MQIKYDQLITNLKDKEPFTLVRYNDGEMMAITNPGCTVARGDQIVPISLTSNLAVGLVKANTLENYIVGLPCSVCYPQHRKVADSLLGDGSLTTRATIFTNRNWKRAVRDIEETLNADTREVYWIGGEDQDTTKLPFSITRLHCLSKNTWSQFPDLLPQYINFPEDAVIFLSCGPTARVLAYYWSTLRPDLTIIDIGSTFDPMTRGVEHNCHKFDAKGNNLAKPCSECN